MKKDRRDYIKKVTAGIAGWGSGLMYRNNLMAAQPAFEAEQGKRIGMIGLDTGHCMTSYT
jgi:hypothetical protein